MNKLLNLLRIIIFLLLVAIAVVLENRTEPNSNAEPIHHEAAPKAEAITLQAPKATPQIEIETVQEEPTPPEPIEVQPSYTEEEVEMLALVIYQEAGGDACSDETRLMVGTVVMNRIADKHYPNTMYEVITQYKQYGRLYWTGLVWPKRAATPEEKHAVERAYAIAERILQGERALPEDVVYQAEFRQGTEVVAFTDGIYFCR